MNNVRKCLLRIVLILTLVLAGLPGIAAMADVGGSAGMDVVLVIDTSGSMKYTDGDDQIALEAAKLFVDMMDCSGSRVGLVSFSDTLGSVVNLTAINTTADKDNIKNTIGSLVYSKDTDIGIAMQKAMEILTGAGDIGNKKTILFFTDGAIDLPNAENPEQAAADSKAMTQSAAASAAAAGIPIYTIGLDASAQDSQFQLDEELIKEVANTTGGTEYTVTSSEELPEIFNQIFANFVESEIVPGGTITIQDSEQYESLPFNIPNDSVMEANIIMLSTARLSDIMLVDPNGSTLAIDNQKVALSISDQYSMLKIFNPQSGDWTLQIKGESGCTVKVNLLFNYDVILKANAVQTDTGADVTAYLENKGQPLTDDAIYADFTNVVARVSYPDGTATEFPMTYASGQFSGSVAINAGDSVSIVVNAQSSTMYRESDPITVSGPAPVPETEPVITAGLSDPIVLKGFLPSMAKSEIDLSDSITTTSGNSLTYTAEIDDSAVAKAEQDGSKLKLTGAKKGTTSLTVTAADPAGVSNTQTVNVEVAPVLNSIVPLIIGLVVLILVIVLIAVLISLKPPKLDGYLYWHLEDEEGDELNGDEEHPLAFDGTKTYVAQIVTEPEVAFVDLNKIEITGIKRKKGGGIIVKSSAKQCELLGDDTAARMLKVRDGDSFTVLCHTDDGDYYIQCYFSLEVQED